MITLSDLRAAQSRLRGIITRTHPIEFNLCAEDPRRFLLKPENQQPIGAFKLRGAYNHIASLSEADRKRGVIYLLQWQSCSGCRLRGARVENESRHRHAQQRAQHQARSHRETGRRNRLRRPRQRRAQNQSRRTRRPSMDTSSSRRTTTKESLPDKAPSAWKFSKTYPKSKPSWPRRRRRPDQRRRRGHQAHQSQNQSHRRRARTSR